MENGEAGVGKTKVPCKGRAQEQRGPSIEKAMTIDAQPAGGADAGEGDMVTEVAQVTVAAPEGEDMEGAPIARSAHVPLLALPGV